MDSPYSNREFKNAKASLLYKHIFFDKVEYIEWLQDKINIPFEFIRLGHIKDGGIECTKVVFELERPFRTRKLDFFTYNECTPIIKPLSTIEAMIEERNTLNVDPDNRDLRERKKVNGREPRMKIHKVDILYKPKPYVALPQWDGSYRNYTIIPHSVSECGIKYGIIEEFGKMCIYFPMKSNLPLILDEIKPLFEMRKMGLHHNNKYIFFLDKGYVPLKKMLNKIELNVSECSKIFAFRYTLHLTSINEASILYKGGKYYDYRDIDTVENPKMAIRIRRDFFGKENIGSVLKSMLYKDYIKNAVLHNWILDSIKNTVERIDPQESDVLIDIQTAIDNMLDNE